MNEYNEFRLTLGADDSNPGQWKVQIIKSPADFVIGKKETFKPGFTRTQLKLLRNRNGWPNLNELKQIGDTVWQTVMAGSIADAFRLSLEKSLKYDKRGMRVSLSLLSQDDEVLADDAVSISELPVEAIYENKLSFLATDIKTPFSRGLQIEPDIEPFEVSLPLRMLVVVATPKDKPEAKASEEVDAIKKALGNLIEEGGPIQLDFCVPATRRELSRRLQQASPYHILHFIGHGGFGIVENDPSEQPHICLEREDTSKSDPINSDLFLAMLLNSHVRLLVMTACSSAAPSPDKVPYDTIAFDGMAQRILGHPNGKVSAAVAMQFDLESEAAVIFTGSFYQNLLNPDKSLDEVVTQARYEISVATGLGPGHRAWITPVIYWRCKGGKVFDIKAVSKSNDEETLKKLLIWETRIEAYRVPLERSSKQMMNQPLEVRQLLANDIRYYLGKITEAQKERAKLLGETIQLWGGNVKSGQEISCPVILRLLITRPIDVVEMHVQYDPAKVSYAGYVRGRDAVGGDLIVEQKPPDMIRMFLNNPSGGQSWTPHKYELAHLKFKAAADLKPSITDLRVKSFKVSHNAAALPFAALNGVLFIEEPT